MKFNPNDWWQEPGLRAASLATRGAWIDICCLMWKSPRRGMLIMPGGCPPDAQLMQRLLGCTAGEWQVAEQELLTLGIADKSPEGILICRRMVREATEESDASDHGRKAAEARWRNAHTMPTDASENREAEKPRTKNRERVPSDDGLALANLLHDGYRKANPKLSNAKVQGRALERLLNRWATEFDVALRNDGKTRAEFEAVIEWAFKTDFWPSKIGSPAKLRIRKGSEDRPVWMQYESQKAIDPKAVEMTRRAQACLRNNPQCRGSGEEEVCTYCTKTVKGSKR